MNTRRSRESHPDWSGLIEIGDGVSLWVERFDGRGDRSSGGNPVILLSEAEAPSSRWPAALIERLRDSVGPVVRFDTRDIGRSAWVDAEYSLDELARDVVGVLDHFDCNMAHVLGRSMGGMIGQLLALDHSHRVATLTLLSTSAGPSDELGSPDSWLVDRMAERLFGGPPRSFLERIEWIAQQQEWFAGPRFAFDRTDAERAAAGEIEQGWRGQSGHGLAVVNSPDRYERLSDIDVPTLIVHGTADPVYPVPHGQSLALGVDGSEIHLIEGLGHELPEEFAPQFADVVVRFLESYEKPEEPPTGG